MNSLSKVGDPLRESQALAEGNPPVGEALSRRQSLPLRRSRCSDTVLWGEGDCWGEGVHMMKPEEVHYMGRTLWRSETDSHRGLEPHVAEPNSGSCWWVGPRWCQQHLVPVKFRHRRLELPSLIGDQPKVDHSEAFWRTATVTHDHCSRSGNARVWWNQGLCDRRRFMKRWRQGMKAMGIRWRGDCNGRRLLIRANAMSRGGRKPLFQRDARGGDDDRRRPKRTRSPSDNPPRWEAKPPSRRSSKKVQERHLSSRRAITKPQGAKAESLSKGLGL